jgi:hypothetical protein
MLPFPNRTFRPANPTFRLPAAMYPSATTTALLKKEDAAFPEQDIPAGDGNIPVNDGNVPVIDCNIPVPDVDIAARTGRFFRLATAMTRSTTAM